MEEIREQQLHIRGRVFTAFSTIEKALMSHKKSFRGLHAPCGPYVLQDWSWVTV